MTAALMDVVVMVVMVDDRRSDDCRAISYTNLR